ncbi:HK97 gp10 family phage protein [Mycolicibacterium sp. A43C]
MSNPFAEFGISDADLRYALENSVEVDAGLNHRMESEIVPHAQRISPVDEGDYAAGWRVVREAKGGKGIVGNTHWKASMIEKGTKADRPGSKSPFGPDTPTPAFAIGQQVARHFGGDLTDEDLSGE